MNEKIDVSELLSIIKQQQSALSRLINFYDEYCRKNLKKERNIENAIVVSDTLVNYYTCLETLFFRVSEYFENNLPNDRWHKALLEKMTLDIEGVRPFVLSMETYNLLEELLRFRHFKRYYFSLDYDWKKLEYLMDLFARLRSLVERDLHEFSVFLRKGLDG